MSNIEKLKPAGRGDVIIYMPYYAKNKHSWLPYAISLYREGSLEGKREIDGGESIPFVASWYISKLPSELTRCRLLFNQQAELSYETTLSNSEFIDYLIDVIVEFKSSHLTDFPRDFYRKLLKFG